MLILTRRDQEQIVITLEDGREITITMIVRNRCHLAMGFDAPKSIKIVRKELMEEWDRRHPPKSEDQP